MNGLRTAIRRFGDRLRRLATADGRRDAAVPAADGHRPAVPRELAGRWIAWSADGRRIVASGRTLDEARRHAGQATSERVSFERLGPAPAPEMARPAS